MTSSLWWRTIWLSVLLVSTSAARGQEKPFELVTGVVVDPGGDAVYYMLPEGGVGKVSISSGSGLWTTTEAAKPLALGDGKLLAQVEAAGTAARLELATLEAGTGAVADELAVVLPRGTRTAVDDGMDRSLALRARFVAGEPLVAWQHEKRYMKGVPPGPEDPLRQVTEAAYRFDLRTRRAVPIEAGALTPQPPALPLAVQTWAASQSAAEAPVAVGSGFAATRVDGDPGSESARVVLVRWAGGGTPLPEVELFRGPHVLQLRSADDRHLLISERRAPGEREEYEWSIFSLETGERVGQIRHARSHTPFFVDGTNLVLAEPPAGWREGDEWVAQPRRLRAVVLGSGSTIWERPLRDTAYYGPFPS